MSEQDNVQLEKIIRQQIDAKNGIDFAEFMGQCLYHPEHGYYMTDRVRVGKQGDFFTSSSVHSLFGQLVARQIRQMWDILGGNCFTIVEQGAGDGHLANDILENLETGAPDLYACLNYIIVEVSPDNRRRQKERLASHSEIVTWSTFEELSPFAGCFLSNELVDAFPVHVVEKRDGALQEVYVVNAENGFGEEFRPDDGKLASYFNWLGQVPYEGNRAEANLAAVQWIREVASVLQKGFVLTIDYGFPSEELYSPYRRNGTLMCYHRHSSNDDPYVRVGAQDITTHVDFTALRKAGSEEGLDMLFFGEQYRFLLALGFVEQLLKLQAATDDTREAAALRMTLKNLIMPDEGMGSTFKILVQGKNVGQPELICRKRIADIPIPFA